MNAPTVASVLGVDENAEVWLLRAPRDLVEPVAAAFPGARVHDGPRADELADVALLWLTAEDDVLGALLFGSESLDVGGRLWVLAGDREDLAERIRARARMAELEARAPVDTPWGRALGFAPRERRQPWTDL